MNASARLVACLLTVCLWSAALGEEQAQSIKGWGDVTDPDGDSTIKEEKGVVTITVPKTHHDLTYTAEYTKLNAPRILQEVEGDFTLTVTVKAVLLPTGVESSGGAHSFQSSGLLVWVDEKNFIRMERAAVAQSEAPFIWVERFAEGKSVSKDLTRSANTDTQLRIARKGKELTFSVSIDDGKEWVEVHAEAVELPAKLKAGVMAISSAAREFPVMLTGLELKGEK